MSSTDYNDLAARAGAAEVKRQLAKAVPAGRSSPAAAPEEEADPAPVGPPTMAPAGLPGLVREIVDAACRSSEAHAVAVAANVICWFACAVGRGPWQAIGDAKIHCRPNMLIVGKSSKARKGTAEITAREVFRRADELLRARLGTKDVLRFHAGGLSTGEGLAYAIRDGQEPDEKGKGGDEGIKDKRLNVIESEFANVMAQVKREGATLSAVVRNVFDGRDIEPLTKTSQTRASKPHVVIVGHITGFELREKSTENDAANGLLNRFVIVHVHRPKLVPLPEPTPDDVLDRLAFRLADAIEYASRGNVHAHNAHEITLLPEARELWCDRYAEITRDRDGRGGNLLARSEMYARMLAMIFALMDLRSEIEPCDLHAALAWIDYWHRSVTYIFQTQEEDAELDEFTVSVLALVTSKPGIKLSEIQEHWNRKRTAQVKASLERLLSLAPPLIECHRDDTTGGRVALRYSACARG
jgi:putative DNA primase/helicase